MAKKPQSWSDEDAMEVTCPNPRCKRVYSLHTHTVCPYCFCWPNGGAPGPVSPPKVPGPKMHG